MDTTLIVNDPAGDWHCDDDSGPGVNPAIEFPSAEAGEYHVWVGVFSPPDVGALAQLSVSEVPEVSLEPEFGSVSLRAGFEPIRIRPVPGGRLGPGRRPGEGCGGYINPLRPDYRFTTRRESFSLRIFVESDVDTTLIVNDPAGDFHCDDDSDLASTRRSNSRAPKPASTTSGSASSRRIAQAPTPTLRLPSVPSLGWRKPA